LQVHREVIERVTAGIEAFGLKRVGLMESPLKGDKSGNTEFLAHFITPAGTKLSAPQIQRPPVRGSDPDDDPNP